VTSASALCPNSFVSLEASCVEQCILQDWWVCNLFHQRHPHNPTVSLQIWLSRAFIHPRQCSNELVCPFGTSHMCSGSRIHSSPKFRPCPRGPVTEFFSLAIPVTGSVAVIFVKLLRRKRVGGSSWIDGGVVVFIYYYDFFSCGTQESFFLNGRADAHLRTWSTSCACRNWCECGGYSICLHVHPSNELRIQTSDRESISYLTHEQYSPPHNTSPITSVSTLECVFSSFRTHIMSPLLHSHTLARWHFLTRRQWLVTVSLFAEIQDLRLFGSFLSFCTFLFFWEGRRRTKGFGRFINFSVCQWPFMCYSLCVCWVGAWVGAWVGQNCGRTKLCDCVLCHSSRPADTNYWKQVLCRSKLNFFVFLPISGLGDISRNSPIWIFSQSRELHVSTSTHQHIYQHFNITITNTSTINTVVSINTLATKKMS
jgi:hypothetical protein